MPQQAWRLNKLGFRVVSTREYIPDFEQCPGESTQLCPASLAPVPDGFVASRSDSCCSCETWIDKAALH